MKILKHRLESFLPLIIGLSLTLEGFEKLFEQTFFGVLILIFGVTLLLYFVLALKRKNQGFALKVIVHLFEAITLFIVSYINFIEGKRYLPYFNLAPSIALFIWVAVLLYKRDKHSDK